MICYIAPPITAVFLLGVLWRRACGVGAQVTLYIGSVLGLVVFLLDWFKNTPGWNVPFMMAAFYLFVVCCGDPGHHLLHTPPPAHGRERAAGLVEPPGVSAQSGLAGPRQLQVPGRPCWRR